MIKKPTLILLALSFVISAPLYAGHHENETAEDREAYLEKQINIFTKKLDLTDAQVLQVAPVLRNKINRKHAVKERMNMEMKNIREEFEMNMHALLGEEQRQDFDKLMGKDTKKKTKKKKRFIFF